MPIFRLVGAAGFPPPRLASPEGLLAVGGDLTVPRILDAYGNGIFPWFSEGDPILWWSPDPRMVLFPTELHVSRRMGRVLRRAPFRLSLDHDFEGVISACARSRADGFGTWITPGMHEAYIHLHREGYAHSLEVWLQERLVGGVYGLSLGRCFFGESMFSHEPNASRYGLIHLVFWLQAMGFTLIDCQVETAHLRSFGARTIPREEFLMRLERCLRTRTLKGNWGKRYGNPQSGGGPGVLGDLQ